MKVIQAHEDCSKETFFPPAPTVQCRSSWCQLHNFRDLCASAKSQCLLPPLLLPGWKSNRQAVRLMHLFISSNKGDGGGWRRFLTWWSREEKKLIQRSGDVKTWCFFHKFSVFWDTARYTVWVWKVLCLCTREQSRIRSKLIWFVEVNIPML